MEGPNMCGCVTLSSLFMNIYLRWSISSARSDPLIKFQTDLVAVTPGADGHDEWVATNSMRCRSRLGWVPYDCEPMSRKSLRGNGLVTSRQGTSDRQTGNVLASKQRRFTEYIYHVPCRKTLQCGRILYESIFMALTRSDHEEK